MAFMRTTHTNTVRARGATNLWRSPWKMPFTWVSMKSKQVELAERIAQQGLSVRETERLVQAASSSAPRPTRAAGQRLDADSRRLQEELAESLGAAVKLKPRRGGKGSVIIDYSSLDELQGIVGKLRRA